MGKKKSKTSKKKPAAAQRELPLERLRTEGNFLKYVKLLKLFAKKYCVMIVASDTPVGPATTREMTGALMEMGLRIDLYGKFRCAYAAVIDAGELAYEELCEDDAQYIDVTLTDEDFKFEANLVSAGLNSGRPEKAPIEINGNNYSSKHKGLHFVIYDKTEHTAIDAVNFDMSVDTIPCFRHLDHGPDEVLPLGSTSKSIANGEEAGTLAAVDRPRDGRERLFLRGGRIQGAD